MISEDLIKLYEKESKEHPFSFDNLFDHLIRKEMFLYFESEEDISKFEYLASHFNYVLQSVDASSVSKCYICLFYENKTYEFVDPGQTYTSHSRFRINYKDIEFLFIELLKGFKKEHKSGELTSRKDKRLEYQISNEIILGERKLIPVTFDAYNKRIIEAFEKQYGEKLNYEVRYTRIKIKDINAKHYIIYYHIKQLVYYYDFIHWVENYNHCLDLFNLRPTSIKDDIKANLEYNALHSFKEF